jgi:hypothetical protein
MNNRWYFLILAGLFATSANLGLKAACQPLEDHFYEVSISWKANIIPHPSKPLRVEQKGDRSYRDYNSNYSLANDAITARILKDSAALKNLTRQELLEKILEATNELVKNSTLLGLIRDEKFLAIVNSWNVYHYKYIRNIFQEIECHHVFDVEMAEMIVENCRNMVQHCKNSIAKFCIFGVTPFGDFDLDIFSEAISRRYTYCWFIEWFVTNHCSGASDEFICDILSKAISTGNLIGVTAALRVLNIRGFDIAGFLNTQEDGKTVLDRLLLSKYQAWREFWSIHHPYDVLYSNANEHDFVDICKALISNGAVANEILQHPWDCAFDDMRKLYDDLRRSAL